MAGHKKGTPGYEAQVARFRKTMQEKYGSRENLLEHLHSIASKGGRNGHTGGFASDNQRAVEAGRKGGAISSRSPKKAPLEERRNKYKENNNA